MLDGLDIRSGEQLGFLLLLRPFLVNFFEFFVIFVSSSSRWSLTSRSSRSWRSSFLAKESNAPAMAKVDEARSLRIISVIRVRWLDGRA